MHLSGRSGKECAPDRNCGGAAAGRADRSHPVCRAAGPREDDTGTYHRTRDGRSDKNHDRPGAGKTRGHCRPYDCAPEGGRALHRRDPPYEPGGRGDPYPAMEDFFIDVMIGEGPSARSIKLTLEHFTLIGATTRQGLLSSPFRDRLVCCAPEPVLHGRSCQDCDTERCNPKDPNHPGRCGRDRRPERVPDITAPSGRVRDFAVVKGDGTITADIAKGGLELLQIDESGLTRSIGASSR